MMDRSDLLKALNANYSLAIGHTEDEIAKNQDDALERYLGFPDGTEVKGKSQVVSRDCAQAVDWAMPDLLEPFLSGDNIVKYEPALSDLPAQMPPDMRQAAIAKAVADAKQATELASHAFWKDNDGFLLLHDAMKGGLIQKVGFGKVWFEEKRVVRRKKMTGVSPLQIELMKEEEGTTIEITGRADAETDDAQDPDLTQLYPEGQSLDITVTRETKQRRLRTAFVPADEIKVSQRAVRLADVAYIVHEPPTTVSDLIAMGFDRETVMSLPTTENVSDKDRSNVRFSNETTYARPDVQTDDPTTQPVRYREEYILLDYDKDGVSERLKVCRVGDTVLGEPEQVDEHPFVGWSPNPLMGRLWGESVVDKAKPIQEINTALSRQMLDNLYLANQPMREVSEGAVIEDGSTYRDLLNPGVGRLVRVKQPGMIREIVTPDRSDAAMRGLAYFVQQREMDTGITRNAVGLSAEAIDPKSAQESKRIDRGSQGRKRLMARCFAEMFLRPLFAKILRLLIAHQDGARVVKIRGDFVPIDPKDFDADMGTEVNVGLGFQNKDEMLQAAAAVTQAQMQAFQIGMVRPEHLYNSAEKLIEAVGWRFADQFFAKPDPNAPPQQEKPDPAVMEAQAKMQLRQQELQFDMQATQMKGEMEARIQLAKLQAQQQIEAGKAQSDFETSMAKIRADYDIKMQQMGAEAQLKREQMAQEVQLKRQQIAIGAITKVQTAKANGAGGQPVRFGGEVG